MIIWGYKKNRTLFLYYSYAAIFSVEPTISVDKLALLTGVTPIIAKRNVIKLLASGYFSDHLFDSDYNCLHLSSQQHQTINNIPLSITFQSLTTAICSNCGTINKIIKGSVAKCGSCGEQITGI
ncbi:MAG TPA: hypothetical protein DCP51_08205 [Clostridiales bacterium]|nr:hypothetical protein [Clostridiales bacterium]